MHVQPSMYINDQRKGNYIVCLTVPETVAVSWSLEALYSIKVKLQRERECSGGETLVDATA